MTIIDADGHVTETQEQLAKYLDAQKRKILGDNARRLYRLEAGGPWS